MPGAGKDSGLTAAVWRGAMMTTPADSITIIRAHNRRLAKLICADGAIEGYDEAKHFDLFNWPVGDLADVHRLLLHLLHRADCAVVRGAIADAGRVRHVRRLAHADAKTGDRPTLSDVARCWLALDMEGVDRPTDVPAADLERCACEAIGRLPEAFHDAECIAQATASHGIKAGCRVRLWYWLGRPATGRELTRWLRHAPADPSVFRAVQPIYTAAPVFAPGTGDHLPQRMIVLPGAKLVAVPPPETIEPPKRDVVRPLPATGGTGAARYAFAALTNAAVRIRQAGVGQRHPTILREARSLTRFVVAGLLTERTIAEVLRSSGQDAGKPEDEIDSITAWAMEHPSAATMPEFDGR
jgi:hypothetical protein